MKPDMLRIAINGFGRIGRCVLRLALEQDDFEVVWINDIAPLETCAYLFAYDSTFGPWPGTVEAGEGVLEVDGKRIPFHNRNDISGLDCNTPDILLDCTGQPERAYASGQKPQLVLLSGPSRLAETTLVFGANEDRYAGERIVSNGSCTTNAVAPLLKVLDDLWGVDSGQMTTTHCYTASQPTVDQARGTDLARSRAAALSMVPTTTSAARLIDEILPDLRGKVEMRALRVPTASVSAVDLTVALKRSVDIAQATDALRAVVERSKILGWTDSPLVSTDLRRRPESLVVCGPELSVSVGGLLRVFGWYDNEWGFSNRLIEMTRRLGRKKREENL